MKKRKSLSVKTRFQVLKRDRYTCQYCGAHPPDVLVVVDHVVPVAAGGSNDPSNLRTACQPCNGGKSDGLLEEGDLLTPSARTLEEQSERLRQAKAYAKLVEDMRAHDDDRVGMVISAWAKAFQAREVTEDGKSCWQLGPGELFPGEASVRKVLKRLPLEAVLDAVDITAAKMGRGNRGAESYFFGVCWRKVDALEAAPAASAPEPAPREFAAVPPSAVVPARREFPDDSPSDFEDSEIDSTEWTPCTPFICSGTGTPANLPDWWDYKRGLPPDVWLESPVEYQDQSAWHHARERQKADPDAGAAPNPWLPHAPHEQPIRNPEWVRYWKKYRYSQEREEIGLFWGPEGVGSAPCVYRPDVEPSRAEAVQIGSDFIAQLRANARSPWTPVRVKPGQWRALIQVLNQEDIFLDHGEFMGMRVWIN
ncbi:MAG TPA: HNH endonuclease, partial [Polyangiaceae bacterium]|nr:HNH endonuclease [Polyangiaceae bacterium]